MRTVIMALILGATMLSAGPQQNAIMTQIAYGQPCQGYLALDAWGPQRSLSEARKVLLNIPDISSVGVLTKGALYAAFEIPSYLNGKVVPVSMVSVTIDTKTPGNEYTMLTYSIGYDSRSRAEAELSRARRDAATRYELDEGEGWFAHFCPTTSRLVRLRIALQDSRVIYSVFMYH